MAQILVLGGTGYVGSRLAPRLIQRGHQVRCLVRNSGKARQLLTDAVEIYEGDVLRSDSLEEAIQGVEIIVYLIHSMGSGEDTFEDLDRQAAVNVAGSAGRAGVRRILYLGGLGRKGGVQSPHLRSRHEVAGALGSTGVPVTEFRAAIIVGAGSVSFEIVHHLVNRLPLMICPRWVLTKTQPIAIEDVLRYLVESVDLPETAGRVIDIGGPDILTFREMMLTVAGVLGLRRFLLYVPVLTPRLSSYWVNLVTPIHSSLARSLIESLRFETVCENDDARRLFDFRRMGFTDAVQEALQAVREEPAGHALSAVTSASRYAIDRSHLFSDQQIVAVAAPAADLFSVISAIGGETGWYYADWLWAIRGWIDRLVGGVGLRRTDRRGQTPVASETIDFWRVEECEPGRRLLLRAEMKVWGMAWLEFAAEEVSSNSSRLLQTAWYYPRGLTGWFYWHLAYPLHVFVFRGMARAIGRHAELTAKNV